MQRDPVVWPGCVVVLVHCPYYPLPLSEEVIHTGQQGLTFFFLPVGLDTTWRLNVLRV